VADERGKAFASSARLAANRRNTGVKPEFREGKEEATKPIEAIGTN